MITKVMAHFFIYQKVLHISLLHKLKENGRLGNLLNVVTGFLYQQKQRVVLNEQYSSRVAATEAEWVTRFYSWMIGFSNIRQ